MCTAQLELAAESRVDICFDNDNLFDLVTINVTTCSYHLKSR